MAAFATGEELRTWTLARSLPELMALVQGVRSLQLEASQAQADAINAQARRHLSTPLVAPSRGPTTARRPSLDPYSHPHQVQLQLAEEARAAGGGGGGGGGGTGTAAEAAAVEAHLKALARISELEEAVGGHAAALEAERVSVATLERQLEAQGGEVASLTQQLQGSILQSIERSNAQLSSQRKKGAR